MIETHEHKGGLKEGHNFVTRTSLVCCRIPAQHGCMRKPFMLWGLKKHEESWGLSCPLMAAVTIISGEQRRCCGAGEALAES